MKSLLLAMLLMAPPDDIDAQWRNLQTMTREALEVVRSEGTTPQQMEALADELIAAHERFLQAHDGHARAWVALARLRWDRGDPEGADAAFARSWSLDPGATGTGVAWASAWMQRDPVRGLQLLDTLLGEDPGNLVLHVSRLNALAQHDRTGIEQRFLAHLEDERGPIGAATMLDAMASGDPALTARLLPVLIEHAGDDHDVLRVRARINRSENAFGNARHLMERLPTSYRNESERRYLYSDTCYAEHDFEHANDEMQAIDIAPLATGNPGLHRRLKFLKPLRQQMVDQWPREQRRRLDDAAAETNPMVVMVIDGQEVWCELYPERAPETVAAFLAMVERGFHDGRPIAHVHRGFRSIFGERSPDDYDARWTLPGEFDPASDRVHASGAMCGLRDSAFPDSADTRFYILHFPAPHLHGVRTNFGRVVSGLDVIRSMDGSEQVDSIRVVRGGSTDATVLTPDGQRVKLHTLLP